MELVSIAWRGAQQGKGCCSGTHPPVSHCNEVGVVDSGEGYPRVVFIKEAEAVSGRRKFPGAGRKPPSDLWSSQLPSDS